MNPKIKPKRPPSVWVAQILVSLIALVFLVIPSLYVDVTASSAHAIFASIVFVIFVFVPITSVIGMAMRKDFGRWFAVGILSLVLIMSILVLPSGPIEKYGEAFTTQPISATISQLVLYGLLLLLIIRMAFSQRVSEFFARTDSPQNSDTSVPIEVDN